jgi:hypothetical protein
VFTISNNRKVGDLSFLTAKGKPVTLRPGRVLDFENEEINDGILRTMIGTGSFYKVLADGDDAQEMINKASQRKHKPKGSPIVHGSTEPVRPVKQLVVRDLKEAAEVPEKQPEQPQEAPEQKPEITPAFIKEEQTNETPAQKLLALADEMPWTELTTRAGEVLGDKLPTRPGRKSIKDALTAFVEAEKVGKQEAE